MKQKIIILTFCACGASETMFTDAAKTVFGLFASCPVVAKRQQTSWMEQQVTARWLTICRYISRRMIWGSWGHRALCSPPPPQKKKIDNVIIRAKFGRNLEIWTKFVLGKVFRAGGDFGNGFIIRAKRAKRMSPPPPPPWTGPTCLCV